MANTIDLKPSWYCREGFFIRLISLPPFRSTFEGMKSIPQNLWYILVFSLLTKLGYAGYVHWVNPGSIFLPDSYQYLAIAQNLLDYSAYSQSPYPNALYPDSMRLPLYPVLLLFFTWSQIPLFFLIILQCFATTATVYLVYRICLLLSLSSKTGLVAAGLIALDLPTLYFSNTLMTEPFFQFLVLWGVYLFLQKEKKWIVISGLIFGLALLLRPILLLLPLLLTVWKISQQKKSSAYYLMILLYLAFPTSWMVRNYVKFQTPIVSTVLHVNLFYHFTPELIREDKKALMEYQNLESELKDYVPVATFTEKTSSIFWQQVQKYPIQALWKGGKTGVLILVKPLRSYFDLQLFKAKHSKTSALTWCLVGIQILLLMPALLFALLSFWKQPSLRWIGFVIGYFVIISCISVPDARFRIPFSPFIYILAAASFTQLFWNESTNKNISR